jgi:hypothetical protein
MAEDATTVSAVYAIDVDKDNDIDVIVGEKTQTSLYENDGSQNFLKQMIAPDTDFATSVFAIDINGDGNMDIVTASGNDDKIAWHENQGLSSIYSENEPNIPIKDYLFDNYPNPFNASTTIRFSISTTDHVTLKIYNVIGEELYTIINEVLPAGMHKVNLDAKNLASGLYFYSFKTSNYNEIKKLILIK